MNFYYWLGYHFSRLAGRLFFRFRVVHRERMIQSGPVILAMNHQSYLDPPLAGITCDRGIYFLARRTLMEVPLLGWLLPKLNVIPVNQEGIDRSALKAWTRDRKDARPGRADADLWGAPGLAAWPWWFALCANHHRDRRTDFFYGDRPQIAREESLRATKPARHECNRCA